MGLRHEVVHALYADEVLIEMASELTPVDLGWDLAPEGVLSEYRRRGGTIDATAAEVTHTINYLVSDRFPAPSEADLNYAWGV